MKKHHQLDYLEFTVGDLPKAKAFYQGVFGWKFTDYGPGYAAFDDGGFEGGFSSDGHEGKKPVLPILYSESLEDSQKAIEKAVGKITKPVFEFPGGRRFHFTDPAGNELAVWSDK